MVTSRTRGWCRLARVLTAVVRIGQELSATLHGGCRPPDRTGSARHRDCLPRGWTKVLQGSGGNGMRTLWLNGRVIEAGRLDSGQQVGRRSAFRRRRHWQYGTSSPHITAQRRNLVRSSSRSNRSPAKRQSFWTLAPVLISTITTLLTGYFLLSPNSTPTTEQYVQLNNVSVETGVSLHDYLRHESPRRFLKRLDLAPDTFEKASLSKDESSRAESGGVLLNVLNRNNLSRLGTAAYFSWTSKGYRKRMMVPRWTLFDADTGQRLLESEANDPFRYVAFFATTKSQDIGTWEFWIPNPPRTSHKVFVRVEFFEDDEGLQITYKDGPKFQARSA